MKINTLSVVGLMLTLTAGAAQAQNYSGKELDELRHKVDVLAEELNRLKTGDPKESEVSQSYGFSPAASKIYRTNTGLAIGGYGEFLYERIDDTKDNGVTANTVDRWDALRAVLYFGYKYSDRFLFNSEIEFEHGSTSKSGEASVEFAYIDAFLHPAVNFRAGLLLIPMGLVNELHEPTVFLGAKRPTVENAILPTTWRENGVGLFGDIGPVSYRTYIVNGLDASGFTSSGLRGGRQKGANAKANTLAWVGRADWQPLPGANLGASGYLGKSGQDTGLDVTTQIAEAHLEWKFNGFEFRALGAKAFLSDIAKLNVVKSLAGDKTIGSQLHGYYLQLGYDVMPALGTKGSLIPFVRWENIDSQLAFPSGYAKNQENDRRLTTVGLSYLPIDQLVFKLDFQDAWNKAGTGLDQVNLSMGYTF